MKISELRQLIKETIKEKMWKNLNEQTLGSRDVCAQLQATDSNLYNYCYSHCNPSAAGAPMPAECPSDFAENCCPDVIDEGCPEGMIDDTSPFWGDCVKCWTNGIETINTGEECECCRPMDDEIEEEKLTCYKCQKKGGNKVITVQFPNNLSSWNWFNFQGECPKGWTTDPDPCGSESTGPGTTNTTVANTTQATAQFIPTQMRTKMREGFKSRKRRYGQKRRR